MPEISTGHHQPYLIPSNPGELSCQGILDNSPRHHRRASQEWLALETHTDVQSLRIFDPARVGDDVQALTFGALA